MPSILGCSTDCLTPFQRLVVEVETIADFLETYMPDCEALHKLDTCCAASMTPGQLGVILTELIECLVTWAGTIGGGGILCGTDDPPTDDPGVTCAKYYNTANGKEWNWNDGAGTWDATIG